MKQYSRDDARKWILETPAKRLSVRGQEPDRRESEIGAAGRNRRQQLDSAGSERGDRRRERGEGWPRRPGRGGCSFVFEKTANTSPRLHCKREVRAGRWEGTGAGMRRKRMRTRVQAEGPGLAKQTPSRNVSPGLGRRRGAGGRAGGCGPAASSGQTEAKPCRERQKEGIPLRFGVTLAKEGGRTEVGEDDSAVEEVRARTGFPLGVTEQREGSTGGNGCWGRANIVCATGEGVRGGGAWSLKRPNNQINARKAEESREQPAAAGNTQGGR